MIVNNLFTTNKVASAEMLLMLADASMDIDTDASFIDRYETDINIIEFAKLKFDAIVNVMQTTGEMSFYTPEDIDYDNSVGSNQYIAKCVTNRGNTISLVLEIEYDITLKLVTEDSLIVILTTDPTYRGY